MDLLWFVGSDWALKRIRTKAKCLVGMGSCIVPQRQDQGPMGLGSYLVHQSLSSKSGWEVGKNMGKIKENQQEKKRHGERQGM